MIKSEFRNLKESLDLRDILETHESGTFSYKLVTDEYGTNYTLSGTCDGDAIFTLRHAAGNGYGINITSMVRAPYDYLITALRSVMSYRKDKAWHYLEDKLPILNDHLIRSLNRTDWL